MKYIFDLAELLEVVKTEILEEFCAELPGFKANNEEMVQYLKNLNSFRIYKFYT